MQELDIWRGVAAPAMLVTMSVFEAAVSTPVRAQTTDTSPTGMVAYFATQSECPTGWKEATYLQGRLALGITDTTSWTPGKQVGTALANVTAPSHEHPFAVTLSLGENELKYGDCGGDNSGGAQKGDYTVNGPAKNNDPDLPLFQILACEKQDSGQSPPPTDGYGTAALAFFNLSSCPTNWIPATGYPQGYQVTWTGSEGYKVVITFNGTDADNDGYIRGRGSDPSQISGGYSNEITAWTIAFYQNETSLQVYNWAQQQQRPDFNFNYDIATGQVIASDTWSTDTGVNVGFHTGTVVGVLYNLASQSNQIIMDLPNQELSTSYWGNTQFARNSAPTLDVNGYFVMPFQSPPDGTVGNLYGDPYANGEERTHTHTLTSSIDLNSMQYESFLGSCKSLTSDGTHDFSGTTDPAFNNVPYTQLLLCEREPNLLATNPPSGVPTNVVTSFGSQNCPYGWKPSATGSGRFFVGLPEGGTEDQAFGGGNPLLTPGDRPQHSHGLSGSVSIPSQNVALATGTDSPIFGHEGTYNYGGHTDYSDFGLAYLTAADCQPCVANDSNPVCQQQAKPK